MNKFQNELIKYANKNCQNPDMAPHFKYKETTYIEPEIAFEIAGLFQKLSTLQNMWEKEKDYNRLLRKENQELNEELYYYNSEDGNDEEIESISSISKEKEYLS